VLVHIISASMFLIISASIDDIELLQMGLLMKFGGSSVKDTVKRVISRLFTNRAMSLMSLHGRSLGKLAFQDTSVCFIVIGMYTFWCYSKCFCFYTVVT